MDRYLAEAQVDWYEAYADIDGELRNCTIALVLLIAAIVAGVASL
jgi:hypothetical protein